jgi:hypothetical protein
MEPEILPKNVDVMLPINDHALDVVVSFAGVMPPSLTMIAPPESWVVELSTAPLVNAEALTALLRSVTEI